MIYVDNPTDPSETAPSDPPEFTLEAREFNFNFEFIRFDLGALYPGGKLPDILTLDQGKIGADGGRGPEAREKVTT